MNNEHKGFDILVPSRTPVLAAAGGVVSRVQASVLYGRQVVIDHAATAAGYRIQTRYFHLSEQRVAVRFLDPQLFWMGGRGKITCYDKRREWAAEPVALSYPVPCPGKDWL
ncbi:MAG: M23 family metallopeptidase [Gammaproteobacteria bacterium]|nr:M23 family metallopeptidase [Gammaproteobacteria bacterium]